VDKLCTACEYHHDKAAPGNSHAKHLRHRDSRSTPGAAAPISPEGSTAHCHDLGDKLRQRVNGNIGGSSRRPIYQDVVSIDLWL
jgi:hypothetical protein